MYHQLGVAQAQKFVKVLIGVPWENGKRGDLHILL